MGGWRKMDGDGLVVLVAVDVTKEITDHALEWAIRNIVQPGDTLILLALLKPTFPSENLRSEAPSKPSHQPTFNQFVTSMLKKCGLRSNSIKDKETGGASDVSNGKKSNSGNGVDEEEMGRLIEVCLEMMNELRKENGAKQVRAQVKLLPAAKINSVADKAEEYQARWVILDRCLEKESEYCTRKLNCNLILVDNAVLKILRLVNTSAEEEEEERSINIDTIPEPNQNNQSHLSSQRSNSLLSSSTKASSSLGFSSEQGGISARGAITFKPKPQEYINIVPEDEQRDESPLTLPPGRQTRNNTFKLNNNQVSPKPSNRKAGVNNIIGGTNESDPEGRRSVDAKAKHNIQREPTAQPMHLFKVKTTGTKISCSGVKQELVTKRRRSLDSTTINNKTEIKHAIQPRRSLKFEQASSIRQVMSISIKQPTKPAPLCSVCKNKSPIFGKPPRKFSYEEIKRSTDGFSDDNFLTEGGYGPVYKGVLEDGQVVAVKMHKKVSALGAAEFCSEVEVLSCAQHRNLVMLVGYCVEGEGWLLVYEFACNGSLDKHLQKKDEKEVMAWHQRQKVAIGTARGLRYLHEDCRVGCIVHRDLRPNNILLTHDFEPMVGDFGLARWQMDGQKAEETRIVGTFGYLAPEYTQTGHITEKTDVYAFGLLLIELISGLKLSNIVRREKLYNLQWATSLMQRMRMHDLIDPRMNGNYVEQEVECMMHVARLCVSPDPEMRPRMSQVLRILEGDMPLDNAYHRQYQTTNNISVSNATHQHTQTPSPISRVNNTASQLLSQTPPPSLSIASDNTCDTGSEILISTARPPIYGECSNSRFEQSNFVQKRYSRQNEEVNNNNMTTETADMNKLNNKRILNQDGHHAAQKYQAYLQELYSEFIQKTKGVAVHESVQ